jgi:dihydrofolate reductase
MMISLVVAIAENGVIGRNGGLPWRLSHDLQTFRRITIGKPVIMGRKTFQSLKKPLEGRDNIVVSRDENFQHDGAIVERDLTAALARATSCAEARGVAEIMVIGGTDVFKEALPLARFIYKTEVHARPDGDALFPGIDWSEWEELARTPLPKGPRDEYDATFILLERKGLPRQPASRSA